MKHPDERKEQNRIAAKKYRDKKMKNPEYAENERERVAACRARKKAEKLALEAAKNKEGEKQ